MRSAVIQLGIISEIIIGGCLMLENKLGITNQSELANLEERISKSKAKALYLTGKLNDIEIGTYKGLSDIHVFLFEDIYQFAGKLRDVNIAKGDFKFAPRIYLEQSLKFIDRLPHETFDEIIDKYSDMNIAHPFREGNGRSARIWLDLMLKKALNKVVDWNNIDKDDYLNAMIRSHLNTGELKYLIQNSLTNDLSKEHYFKGIDTSYYYEGYAEYKTNDL